MTFTETPFLVEGVFLWHCVAYGVAVGRPLCGLLSCLLLLCRCAPCRSSSSVALATLVVATLLQASSSSFGCGASRFPLPLRGVPYGARPVGRWRVCGLFSFVHFSFFKLHPSDFASQSRPHQPAMPYGHQPAGAGWQKKGMGQTSLD